MKRTIYNSHTYHARLEMQIATSCNIITQKEIIIQNTCDHVYLQKRSMEEKEILQLVYLWNTVPSIFTFSINWRVEAWSAALNDSRMLLSYYQEKNCHVFTSKTIQWKTTAKRIFFVEKEFHFLSTGI